MLIDLTHTLTATTPVFPGDAAIKLEQVIQAETSIMDHRLTTGMHVGTHMDGPRHMLPTGRFLHEFPLEKFTGPGRLIDCRGKHFIDEACIADHNIAEGDIVLFYTNQSHSFSEPHYFEKSPVITKDCAEKLIELKIKMIGLDFPSPDNPPFDIHKALLSHEILIIENLTDLHLLEGKNQFEIIALPLKTASDSAPTRVIALA